MKNSKMTSVLFALASGIGYAQINPGYSLQTVTFASPIFTSNNSARPLVGDIAIYPDGRVAVAEWGVPSSVFILSGLQSGTSNIQVTRFAKGLDNVMGLAIANDVLYVMEKEALTQLVDTDGNGVADEYNNINQTFASNNGMLNFPYDVDYLGGSFYSGMSSDVHTGGMDWGSSSWAGTPALLGRSTMYRMNMDGTSSAFACGFRNPNGVGLNGSDIFASENEGSWTPASKIINVKQGRFYGHRQNPPNACQTATNNVESPPVVWASHDDPQGNTTGCSWGNPLVLQTGRFAGHILVPELCNSNGNKVLRTFVETVGGELQGVTFPFIKTFPANANCGGDGTCGVMRVNQAANGEIYLGHLGASGGWGGRSGMAPGFSVLRENATAYFEVRAIRTLGANSFELEFTQPVGASGGTVGNYTVRAWQNIAAEGYGAGEYSNMQTLTVTSATVNANRVTVNITGLQTGRVVKFNFGPITSSTNATLFTQFAMYTLTRFGPGTDYLAQPTPVVPKIIETGWKLVSGDGAHYLRFVGDVSSSRNIAVYDLRGGKRLEKLGVTGTEVRLETGKLSKGMYMVRVSGAHKVTSGALMIP